MEKKILKIVHLSIIEYLFILLLSASADSIYVGPEGPKARADKSDNFKICIFLFVEIVFVRLKPGSNQADI